MSTLSLDKYVHIPLTLKFNYYNFFYVKIFVRLIKIYKIKTSLN